MPSSNYSNGNSVFWVKLVLQWAGNVLLFFSHVSNTEVLHLLQSLSWEDEQQWLNKCAKTSPFSKVRRQISHNRHHCNWIEKKRNLPVANGWYFRTQSKIYTEKGLFRRFCGKRLKSYNIQANWEKVLISTDELILKILFYILKLK